MYAILARITKLVTLIHVRYLYQLNTYEGPMHLISIFLFLRI